MTALQYAKIAQDSRFTSIYQRAPNHFVMVNEGELRTFRLRSTDLVPDLSRSSGVVGYVDHEGFRYLHTDGRRRIELILAPSAKAENHLFLEKSSGETIWGELSRDRIRFEVNDVRPISVVLGGVQADVPLSIVVNGAAQVGVSDRDGKLKLELPSHAKVEVSISEAINRP